MLLRVTRSCQIINHFSEEIIYVCEGDQLTIPWNIPLNDVNVGILVTKQVGHVVYNILIKSPGMRQPEKVSAGLKLYNSSIVILKSGFDDAGLYSLHIVSPTAVPDYPIINVIVHRAEGT